MSLISINEFDQISQKFKETKQNSKDLSQSIQNYIEDQTLSEKQELEQAIEKYNKKVQSIMKNKEKEIATLNDYNKEISETLANTHRAFYQASQAILDDTSLNDNQKEEKIQQISDYIMGNLYTKQEIDEFKKMANNFVILLPNEHEGYSKKVEPISQTKKKRIEYI